MIRYYAEGKGEISKEEFDKLAKENRKIPFDGTFESIFYRGGTNIMAYDDKKGDLSE